jgi:hypothetical protein
VLECLRPASARRWKRQMWCSRCITVKSPLGRAWSAARALPRHAGQVCTWVSSEWSSPSISALSYWPRFLTIWSRSVSLAHRSCYVLLLLDASFGSVKCVCAKVCNKLSTPPFPLSVHLLTEVLFWTLPFCKIQLKYVVDLLCWYHSISSKLWYTIWYYCDLWYHIVVVANWISGFSYLLDLVLWWMFCYASFCHLFIHDNQVIEWLAVLQASVKLA